MYTSEAVIAANRFGLGARPGELGSIGSDPRGWLREQVRKPQAPTAQLTALAPSERVLQEFFAVREERPDARKDDGKPDGDPPTTDGAGVVANIRQTLLPHYLAQAEARVRTAVHSTQSFHERLVQFWTNQRSRGTDHGTATCAFLAGGAVAGGRVVADWPGLATRARHEGRDLAPTLDLRAVFKSVLHDHLRVSSAALENDIFPDSGTARALPDLLRA